MMAKGSTPAIRFLECKRATFSIHQYEFSLDRGSIGLDAAGALGVDPDLLLKTLIVTLDHSEMICVLIPAGQELNLKKIAKTAGGKKAELTPVEEAQRATGYMKGGISPFAQKKRLRCFADTSLKHQSEIYVNGGRRGLQLCLEPARLISLCQITLADLI